MSTFLVVGDFMTDQYYLATVRGKSAERSEVDVLTVTEQFSMPGGAGNVYTNLKALGQDAVVVARERFPIKTRIIVDGKQVVRFDQNDRCIPPNIDFLQTVIDSSGLNIEGVIVSDYGKGSITDHVRQVLIDSGKVLFVDTKSDPSVWLDQDELGRVWLFPNSVEFEQFEGNYRRASQVIWKRGSNGIARLHFGTVVRKLPAFTKPCEVVDVCGAGDTVLAAFATQLIAHPTAYSPLVFANAAAAVTVQKPYTSTATIEEITQLLDDPRVQTIY